MSTLSRRDKLIPWYFVAFFVVLALVDGTMVTLAVRTQTGLVTQHPYEKGLAYNQVVKAEEQQKALGWKSDIKVENGMLLFALKDAEGKLLNADKVIANILRPTQAGMDFVVEIKNGKTPITFPAKGLWEVRVNAEVGAIHYQQSKRIVIP